MEPFFFVLSALGMAALLTAMLSGPYRQGGGWGRLAALFLVIFLFTLAGGLWTAPYASTYGGVPWFGVVFWGLLIGLLFAAFPTRPRPRRDGATEVPESAFVAGGVFWVLMAALLGAVLWGALR